jgi:hypothetical protein
MEDPKKKEAMTSFTADLCGAPNHAARLTVYCTLPRGHDGEHVAAIGPYTPTTPVLARWPQAAGAATSPVGDS